MATFKGCDLAIIIHTISLCGLGAHYTILISRNGKYLDIIAEVPPHPHPIIKKYFYNEIWYWCSSLRNSHDRTKEKVTYFKKSS